MAQLPTCSRCERNAVTFRAESGVHLCNRHFIRWVEKTFRKSLRKQLGKGTKRVGVAVSGGKDSSVLLYLLAEWAKKGGAQLFPITIDEGIPGYRDESITEVERLCAQLGLELHRESFEQATGFQQITIAQGVDLPGGSPCGPCGILRRSLMNEAAVKLEVDVLATGHNLDDMAQTVLMNLVTGQPGQISRMAPHQGRWEGLIPRIVPLTRIPERDVYLYAHLKKLPIHHGECPLAERAGRGVYRDLLAQLEEAQPGSRHGLLNTAELLRSDEARGDVNHCKQCGLPAAAELCKACSLKRRLPVILDHL